jgi:cell division protein FtsW
MFYLPEARTDFIFAVIGEELGLWGTSLVLFLFLLLGQRGLRIALRHPSLFGRLLALGLTLLLVWQAGINMAVVTGLVPTKGISLPLVSYGGSGLVIAMLSAGVLLALSRETGRKKVVSP